MEIPHKSENWDIFHTAFQIMEPLLYKFIYLLHRTSESAIMNNRANRRKDLQNLFTKNSHFSGSRFLRNCWTSKTCSDVPISILHAWPIATSASEGSAKRSSCALDGFCSLSAICLHMAILLCHRLICYIYINITKVKYIIIYWDYNSFIKIIL